VAGPDGWRGACTGRLARRRPRRIRGLSRDSWLGCCGGPSALNQGLADGLARLTLRFASGCAAP